MCGIVGIWGNVTSRRLEVMTRALRHRGPDDDGYWISPRGEVGLASCRLAIIDLVTGQQPRANEDGRIVTVFNGEIYNYLELREELMARGHTFATQGDTEVIVHLYEELGLDFPSRLRGMFAIALWDENVQRLLLVRDRAGKKPLYYSESGGEFRFASEIKGLLAGASSGGSIDEQALADFFVLTAIPAPRTIYREVRAVEPGQRLVVRERRVVQGTRFWRLSMAPKIHHTEGEALERIDALLTDAVRLRFRSDVPVGIFLSGGIDSGLVTAVASKVCTGRLKTLTVGFEDGAFDERPLARLVAQRYGTDHEEIVVRADVEGDLPQILAAYDQPFGDSSAIPTYYVARAARRHVKVVLNGDGGDEVFAGYRRYVAAWLQGLLRWTDGPLARDLWQLVAAGLPSPARFRSGYAFAHRWIEGLSLDPVARYLAWTSHGFKSQEWQAMRRIGRPSDGGSEGIDTAARCVQQVWDSYNGCGPVDRMLATDFTLVLPHDWLVKMDIATMAHGLEARSPFLDHVLIETASRLPEGLKLRGLRTKRLLRALARRYLPQRVRRAPKRGFEVPLVRWLRGPLRDPCRQVILDPNGLVTGLFQRAALERLVDTRAGLTPWQWSTRVWLLFVLGLWDRHRRHTPAEVT